MFSRSPLPKLGEVLRHVITDAGLRPLLNERGMDKGLDDAAIEARPESTAELIAEIEQQLLKAVHAECGPSWHQWLDAAWRHTRTTIQTLVQNIDEMSWADEDGQELYRETIQLPLCRGLLQSAQRQMSGPPLNNLCASPFHTWVEWLSAQLAIEQAALLERLESCLGVDMRSLQRWLQGKPIKKSFWPLRKKVEACVDRALSERQVELSTGWLIVAITLQNIPTVLRVAISQSLQYSPPSLDNVINCFAQREAQWAFHGIRKKAIPLIIEIEELFASTAAHAESIQLNLQQLQQLIRQGTEQEQAQLQYQHDWLSARLAAFTRPHSEAVTLYLRAVEQAWWRKGANQKALLTEALLFAVGAGEQRVAKHFWDKTFLLGINHWPKRPFDEQQRRSLALAFEHRFQPLKAHDRVPPALEMAVLEGPFRVTSEALEAPNRKVKYADGRTRRTPLMQAVMMGTLADVKALLERGGDPNDYIPESGEGPISYAMRRACDQKDPAIMNHLLSAGLTVETVNRHASTKKETPMKWAIEMADATAVEQLLQLGAQTEISCGYQASALCYAMALFHHSKRPETAFAIEQEFYVNGKTRGDAYDAKEGVAVDVDLPSRRLSMLKMMQSPHYRDLFQATREYYSRPLEDRRQVIEVLLKHGANPNRRYRVQPEHIAEWTPTLFAAEIGDLALFKLLLSYGGDAALPLIPSNSPLQTYDALWIAIDHDRREIVQYLTQRV